MYLVSSNGIQTSFKRGIIPSDKLCAGCGKVVVISLRAFTPSLTERWVLGPRCNSLLICAKTQDESASFCSRVLCKALLIQPASLRVGRRSWKWFGLSSSLLSGPSDKSIRLNMGDKREGVWGINIEQRGMMSVSIDAPLGFTTTFVGNVKWGNYTEAVDGMPQMRSLWKQERKPLDQRPHFWKAISVNSFSTSLLELKSRNSETLSIIYQQNVKQSLYRTDIGPVIGSCHGFSSQW